MTTFIHPTACVDETARIAAGCKVWHFCNIQKNASLGEGCVLGQNVNIGPGVTVGRNCKIQNNVSIYEGVLLEDDVFCGPSMVFTNVLNPRSHVSRRGEFLPTVVRRGATLGANCTIVCGLEIASFTLVGAGAVVTRSTEAYGLYVGNPARWRGFVCGCGELLGTIPEGTTNVTCPRCSQSYLHVGPHQIQAQ